MEKEFGCYPPREMLIEIARMGKVERKEDTWYGMFSDVRKCGWGGVFKMQNEKWEAILKKGDKRSGSKGASGSKNSDSAEQFSFWYDSRWDS